MRTAGTGTMVGLSHDEFQQMAHEVMPLERCHYCAYDETGDHVAAYCAYHLAKPDIYIERPRPAAPELTGDFLVDAVATLEPEPPCPDCTHGILCAKHMGTGAPPRPYVAPAITSEREATPEDVELLGSTTPEESAPKTRKRRR